MESKDNNGIGSKTTKEKVRSLSLKAKVTREQTSDNSDNKGGSDEDIDEEEAEAFNLLARNFRKGNRCGHGNRFGNGGIQSHFASECRNPKENKAFVRGAWSDSEDIDEHQNDTTCLMAIDSQEVVCKQSSSNYDLDIIELQKENEELLNKINDLELEVKKLAHNKEVVEPCKICDVLTKEVDSLKCNVSKLQDEAFNFLKFKESSIALDDMLSRQKLSQDKEGLGFSKNDKTSSARIEDCLLRTRRMMGHVIFGSNLKGKVVGGGNITHDSITITNVEYVSGLAFNLISVGSQGNANNRTRNEVSTSMVLELLQLDLFGPSPIQSYGGYSQTSKAYIVLNKETIRIEESLNVTFDESLPEPKSSPSVEDDKINEPIVQDLNDSPSLQVNVSDEGYPKSVKEARGHLIEQVIGELNERTLRSKTKQA
ncbi:hypothetical protein Tco_0684936 [Tanacetum coccineum]